MTLFSGTSPRSDPQGYEDLTHRERPVATQRSLCNCVDLLAALSHVYATLQFEACL